MNEKRILICEFHEETNTFNPIVNDLEYFNAGDVFEGERIFQKRISARTDIQGAVNAIAEAGGEVIPTIFLRSGSGGRVSDTALALVKERVKYYIDTVGEFDGVYVGLHGATCTESCDDACGDLLEFLRKLIGNKPMTASCDLHAKITEQMLENVDFICGYQTYPHVDQYETGYRAAKLCMEMLAGRKMYCAACHIPMLVPPAGYTTAQEPFKDVMDSAFGMLDSGELIDFSIFCVQPWLDVKNIASTVITVAENAETAKQKAEMLAKKLFEIRDGMWPEMLSVNEIIDRAEANTTGKVVILSDPADSHNGGCVGDSSVVAMTLQTRGSKLKTAMFIRDEQATAQAFQMGTGATGEFSVGATLTPGMPGPFRAVGTVERLYENDIETGAYPEFGRCAVVAFDNIRVIICENGSSSHFPDMYRAFGIEPAECQLLVVKANTSFRAHYAPLTDLIYVADTPGAGASNLRQLKWGNLPKGLYPFDLPENYTIKEAKLW